jgi:hypothetical protein
VLRGGHKKHIDEFNIKKHDESVKKQNKRNWVRACCMGVVCRFSWYKCHIRFCKLAAERFFITDPNWNI